MTNNIAPPPIVNKINYKACIQINNPITNKRLYETPDGEFLPSVTTILSATKDMKHLDAWKKFVGEEKAATIVKEASAVGTAMHANLERFVLGQTRMPGKNLVHLQANKMADVIIENGFKHVDEIWALEQSLYYPGLYSGTTDGVGVYKGNPMIFDHKQTNKPKKEEWVEDYRVQLVAYIMAHNEVYQTDIKEGHIFMCSRDLKYQQFDLWPEDFNKYQDIWLGKIEAYYAAVLALEQ